MEDGFPLRDSTVGIIGLGLMGGSLAMSLHGKCARIIGFDSHLSTLELALSKRIIDQAEAFVPAGRVGRSPYRDHGIDIFILATPVPTIIDILQELPSLFSHPCIVMDIGSTKRVILQAMSDLPDNFDPVGGHPICGRENLGLENAAVDLYQNAPFVITPLERTTQKAKSAVQQIISIIGANLIEMTADDHDRVLASTSHLPFLLSSALSNSTPQEFASLIGPGFRSTSRLAGTPSHMMMGILKSNRDNVLKAIQTFRGSLDGIESALQDENYSKLELLLNQSRSAYHSIIEN
jgi:prephenate dehydrogenase